MALTQEETRRVEIPLGDAVLTLETGKLARQAGGAVTVRLGDTMVLVTATGSATPREGIDFLPLTVDYEEKMYAAGKIPGGFFKREGRPGEKAILSARLTDRPIRPLFPKGLRHDIQVITTVLSVDQEHTPDILSVNGASAALMLSDIPWDGPVGCVRVGLVGGAFVLNPTLRQIEHESDLDLVVAGTDDAIIMVEAGASEVPEERVFEAFAFAHAEIRRIIAAQRELAAKAGKPKRAFALAEPDPALVAAVRERARARLDAALRDPDKLSRENGTREAIDEAKASLLEQFPDREKEIVAILEGLSKEIVRGMILNEGRRPDGRGPGDVRPLSAEVGVLPRTHGSGLFRRGQTQVLTTCTLGSGEDEQILDDLGIVDRKRYMHHYSFPPFSVGEVRPLRGPGRREIGHGNLAERALEPMVPPEEEFPYTVRLVSEVLESNGSTSMASVCASTLALMDAGVPIRAPVAGISIGLVTGDDGRAETLTDIQGIEDAMGDMDFKVAGTRTGITALQLDIKTTGLSQEILRRALAQARDTRLVILDLIGRTIPAPRSELSPYAPRILTIQISPDKIREVIGPGGKVINKITSETGAKIDIEQDGRVMVASPNLDAAQRAVKMIEDIVREVKVGETYLGRVTRLMNFGAFVEVLPGKEGLVHISELSNRRLEKVQDAVNVGDQILVRVKEIDNLGRVNLTRRGLLPDEEGEQPSGNGQEAGAPPRRQGDRPRRRRGGPRRKPGPE